MTYDRRGNQPGNSDDSKAASQGVKIDGFEQVLEMLRIADPAFRESLLKRLAARDAKLAASLRADLKRD